MILYVVIGVRQGVVEKVGASLDYSDAVTASDTLSMEYGEAPDKEVIFREVEVEEIPASVLARRRWW